MNQVILTGVLRQDPEIVFILPEKTVRGGLRLVRPEHAGNFYIEVWGDWAQWSAENLKKGDNVYLEGRLKQHPLSYHSPSAWDIEWTRLDKIE